VALVDELAHTNVVGSTNGKRWQDVDVMLDAGIEWPALLRRLERAAGPAFAQ